MNSHQRRKDKKRWRYHVNVYESYTQFGYRSEEVDHYMAMFTWCKENYGDNVERCGWRDRDYGVRWEFTCPKKAAMFALKWAS